MQSSEYCASFALVTDVQQEFGDCLAASVANDFETTDRDFGCRRMVVIVNAESSSVCYCSATFLVA